MSTFTLTDQHPTVKKLDQIFELAKTLGITIWHTRAGYTMVDDDTTGKSYYLTDVENRSNMMPFPPVTEYKLTYEK